MKNIKSSYKSIMSLFMTLLLWGCTSDFDEINTNPNTISKEDIGSSLAGASFSYILYTGIHQGTYSIDDSGDNNQGTYGIATGLYSMVFSQYMSASWAATDANGIRNDWRGRGWTPFYTLAAPSLNNAYEGAEGDADATAVLDIWKVFMYHQMTDEWGDIPYSEAAQGGYSIAYDTQEEIYADFFELLEGAETTLSASSSSTVDLLASFDRIYNGDISKWRKFCNSLRLRLALRISNVDPTEAQSQAEAAIATGMLMTTNDDAAYYQVSDATGNNFCQVMPSWGFYLSASMESILEGYEDPRLSVWFTEATNSGEFTGEPNGAIGLSTISWSSSDVSSLNSSTFGTDLASTKDMEVMLTSETYFNLAEAALNGWSTSGTAQSYYEEGIRLSMDQWGIDGTEVDNYIAGTTLPTEPGLIDEYSNVGLDTTPPVQVPVTWAGSEDDQRTQIAVQKYLALFPESWEAWSDLRRTDADILYPLLTTQNTDAEVGRGLMKRLTYVSNEYTTNTEAVNEAASRLDGGDRGGASVWWDVD